VLSTKKRKKVHSLKSLSLVTAGQENWSLFPGHSTISSQTNELRKTLPNKPLQDTRDNAVLSNSTA